MSASCRSNLVVLIAISRPAGGVRCLTATERRVVRLLALGCDARRIATLLRRDVAVVWGCTARARRKIGAETRTALARWARGHGVSPPGDRLSVPEQPRFAVSAADAASEFLDRISRSSTPGGASVGRSWQATATLLVLSSLIACPGHAGY